MQENGFGDLMTYDSKTDELTVTEDVKNGDSDVLKAIAANIKDFAGDWDAVWENIMLRANIKEKLVEYAEKEKNDELLEAPFVIKCNDMFHLLSEKVRSEVGHLDSKLIFKEWEAWLKRELSGSKIKNEDEE